MISNNLTIIGTCPAYPRGNAFDTKGGAGFLDHLAKSALCAEKQGWDALLVYSDNSQLDPWLLATAMLEATSKLSPLVAVQPIYVHPFALAKSVASLSLLYQRPVHLNLIAGGFPRDLEALGDDTRHDRRYDRLAEYGTIIQELLKGSRPVSLDGEFYSLDKAQLFPPLTKELYPMFTMAGSSNAGIAAAKKLQARSIQYLRPSHEYENDDMATDLPLGTRVGIIARSSAEEAWDVARKRFPKNELGTAFRQLAVQISDSVWVKELGREISLPSGHPYWLGPYSFGYQSCPFLVGDENTVAAELANYIRLGMKTFLVAEAQDEEDASYITKAFSLALKLSDRALATASHY